MLDYMQVAYYLVLIIACAFLDRSRGNGDTQWFTWTPFGTPAFTGIKVRKWFKQILYGLCMGLAIMPMTTMVHWCFLPFFALVFWGTAVNISYGMPWGAVVSGYFDQRVWRMRYVVTETPSTQLTRSPGSKKMEFEGWQYFNFLRKNAFVALIFRGFIGGLPFLLMALFIKELVAVPVAYMIAFPVAAAFGYYTARLFKRMSKAWPIAEWARGAISCSIGIAIGLYFAQFPQEVWSYISW